MVAVVHKLNDYAKGNTQSCDDLVNYLSKENEGKQLLQYENYFNSTGENLTDFQVIQAIDNNKKGLKKDEAKFFMLSINPSKKELKHIAYKATGREISELSQMTKVEQEKYNMIFKEYVNDCMELYAQGFNKGLTKEDILYFAKVEQDRTYKGKDKEVKEGKAKNGEKKPGLQTHCHIIVSRKDRSMKYSISPLANSKGKSNKHQLNGKNVQVGFDREKLKLECETLFDIKFEYDRAADEYYLNAKANKYTQTVSHEQYSSYIKNFKSISNFSGHSKDDSGSRDAAQLLRLAKSLKEEDLKGLGRNINEQLKGVHASEFNKVPSGQFLALAKGIASGNPISIVKQIVRIISGGMEI